MTATASTKLRSLSEDELRALSEEDLADYEATLESAYWEKGKNALLDFCDRVEIPGAPIDEDDETKFFPAKVRPAAHHKLIIDAIQKLADGQYNDVDGVMIFMPPGAAKALALDTPIPTPGGWRRMGDLQIGDRVFDEAGKVCNVTWVSPVWKNRPVYRVLTDCGDEIIADRDHEWLVRLCRKTRRPLKKNGLGRPPNANRDDPSSHFKIKETWQLARKRHKRPLIKRASALELPEAELPIDPYLLGVWLGDGTSSTMTISSSVDDQPWMRAELERLGYKTGSRSVPTIFAVHGVRAAFVSMGLIDDTHHNTYGRKHIPQVYMRASASQRLALLQGLIDTDGTVCRKRGSATFCNTNVELALQVRELVRSLGVKAGWSETPAMLNGKFCGMAYKVSFYLKNAARLPRKARLCRDQYRTPDTYVEVEPAGIADTVCIEVDSPSHLFLAGYSMTPTHNSSYASVLAPAWLLGRNPGVNVIATSYGDDLAQKFGRRVRHICRSGDFSKVMSTTIRGDNQDVKDWSLENGSEYRASGLQGTITGIRADFLLIDDPVKNAEEANSQIIRDKIWEAYNFNVDSRLKPKGKIFIIMTRWSEDDLCGRLLGEKWKGQSGLWRTTDGLLYHVINLPLLAEHPDDPLGRKVDELLWPEWFERKKADRLRENARKGGTFARLWSSLYQQRPAPNEGAILAKHYWRKWEKKDLPECSMIFLCYDTAFEEGEENDYSAMTAWGVFDHTSKKSTGEEFKHQHVILLGAWMERVSAVDLMDIAVTGYDAEDEHGRRVKVKSHCQLFTPDIVLVEKRASGIQLIQEMKRKRIPVKAWLPKGKPGAKGKLPRAHAIAVILEQGSVWYVPGTKTEAVLDQCAAFPFGTHDDGVDTVTMALAFFRDKWIFKTAEDELDEDELKEALLARSDALRSKRRLYSGPVNRSATDWDASEIEAMTPETRRRLYG